MAIHLAQHTLNGDPDVPATAFDDLWAFDAKFYQQFQENAPRPYLVQLLLESPARLVARYDAEQPLAMLFKTLASQKERVLGAAGCERPLRDTPYAEAWLRLHTPLPFELPDLDSAMIPRQAMLMLAWPLTPWQRAAALYYLLHRATTRPILEQDGMTLDLRKELASPLAAAFAVTYGGTRSSHEDPESAHLGAHSDTWLALAQAATTYLTLEPAQAFAVATWIKYLLLRSPFIPGDIERIQVLARAAASGPQNPGLDLLSPYRLNTQGNGVHPDELALLWPIHRHQEESRALNRPAFAIPEPIIDAIRRIAYRGLNEGEKRAMEFQLNVPQNQFHFPEVAIAPPLLAGRILSDMGAKWLVGLKELHLENVLRYVEQVASEVGAHSLGWFWMTVYREGSSLEPSIGERIAATWAKLHTGQKILQKSNDSPPELALHLFILAGAGILPWLELSLRQDLLEASKLVALSWRPGIASAVANAASKCNDLSLWTHSIEALGELLRSNLVPDQQRLDAAVLLARAFNQPPMEIPLDVKNTLLEASRRPPLVDNSIFRSELRRSGLR